MAGLGVELLVGLVLLLLPVRGWEPIDESKLLSLYEAGRWTDARGFSSEGYGYEPIPEDELPEVEGAATSNMDAFGDYGFHVAGGGPVLTNLPSSTDGQYEVEFVDAPPRSWTSSTSLGSNGLDVVCTENGFQITLHTGQLSEVRVLGSTDMLPVMDAPESCGYDVNPLRNTLTVPFGGCHVKHSFQTDSYGLELLYINEFGRTQVATAYCEESLKFDPGQRPRSDKPKEKCLTPPPSPAQNCAVATGERVSCGESQISSAYCEKIGCCVDSVSSVCYYPLDECTGDQHFVFAIRFDSASIPVDPTKLVIPGYPNCKPVLVNDKVAIFKFKVTECGTRAYEVGETKIYLAEVQSVVQALNLKYGVITRSDPLKFMVECRYSKDGNTQQSLASVGYMVMTPSSTLPSSVIASGLYAVQLRIATDSAYSSYLPTYQQPLRLLLGKPVYLELYLNTPLPKAVILVNYCLAYPFSAKNALVLVYERCANPFDPNVSILQVSDAVKSRYTKRFMVTAFQFMDQTTNKYLDEEIYFMCSTEVCFPSEKICEERCI
ncbi:zona pellucida sperm-binding protein 4-like [Hippoglossus stenolepis]|uniref:zona pellucida sperm-binding protein 4-like n=1 Tax=Hippoglossus stenolepis TaxID=195615 RepID=UPI00159C5507|nr:zona pellucida sperm-binding protein 4-like [Hippoglossus stenolepis]